MAPCRRFLLSALTLLLVGGCNTVYVSRPIGDRPHALTPEKWNGTWLTPENSAIVALVTDAAQGKLEIASITSKEGQLVFESETLFVRESGDWLFVNLRQTDAQQERYVWGRIKFDEGRILLWGPNVEAFRALVRSGRLKGTAEEKGDVHLEPLSPDAVKALVAGELGMVFEWEHPGLFRRADR